MPVIINSRKAAPKKAVARTRPDAITHTLSPQNTRLVDAMDAARVCVWTASVESLEVLSLFPPAPGFLRTSRQTPPGASWLEKVHPSDKEEVTKFLSNLTETDVGSFIEYRLQTADDDSLWIRHWISGFDASSGAVTGALSEIEEIRWLRRESIHISEREQNRIGQELHDDLCQVLAGLGCLLRVLENRVAKRAPEEVANLREINRQMVEAMERTRALTHGLFPGRLKTLTVREALLELAGQLETRFPAKLRLRFLGDTPAHNSDAILNIYRIAQEASSNAIRHGGANRIDISLRRHESGVMELNVKDDGRGYSKPGDGVGIGMEIMRNRARMLGGDLTVSSAPGKGVSLTVRYEARP